MPSVRAILLAAGAGRRMGPLAEEGPKSLVPVLGEPLLVWTLQSLVAAGINEILIVVGYQKEKIFQVIDSQKKLLMGRHLAIVENPLYKLGNIVSLWASASYFDSDLLIMDADVYFTTSLLKRLLSSRHENCFLLDDGFQNTGEEVVLMTRGGRVLHLAKTPTPPQGYDLVGETVGFLKICQRDAALLKEILREKVTAGETTLEYEQAYEELLQKVPVGFELVGDEFWTEIDFPGDLEKLQKKLGRPIHRMGAPSWELGAKTSPSS